MSDTETAVTKPRKPKTPKRASAYRPGTPYMTRAQMPGYIKEKFGVPVRWRSCELNRTAITDGRDSIRRKPPPRSPAN